MTKMQVFRQKFFEVTSEEKTDSKENYLKIYLQALKNIGPDYKDFGKRTWYLPYVNLVTITIEGKNYGFYERNLPKSPPLIFFINDQVVSSKTFLQLLKFFQQKKEDRVLYQHPMKKENFNTLVEYNNIMDDFNSLGTSPKKYKTEEGKSMVQKYQKLVGGELDQEQIGLFYQLTEVWMSDKFFEIIERQPEDES